MSKLSESKEDKMKKSNSYLALHSPVGAAASFAIGMSSRGGGFMHRDAFAPTQELYIGTFCEDTLNMLPFFSKATNDYRESFVKSDNSPNPLKITYYTEQQIDRTYGPTTDSFDAKNGTTNLKYELFSPAKSVPDPENEFNHENMKHAVCPSILTKLTVDNSNNSKPAKGFFGIGNLKGLAFPKEIHGVVSIDGYGFAAKDQFGLSIETVADFDPVGVFGREIPVRLGIAPMGMLVFDVPAGASVSVEIVLAWYQQGPVTHGATNCKFYYTHFFNNILDVFTYTFENTDKLSQESKTFDALLALSPINDARKFLVSHAIHSYYASTMLFDSENATLSRNSQPRWCVNEGSFMMMNTFDLAIDHAFFELSRNPWVVKNVLDIYTREYSYFDNLGLSFTHDHGSHFTYSPHGYSAYEISNQDGCFSYMTQEQLCNWILIAGLYVEKTKDIDWLQKNQDLLKDSITSLLNRDASDDVHLDGIMDLDSSRCGVSSEITTYDSLDHSLGQATRNLYVGTKCWASYITLSHLFKQLSEDGSSTFSDIINTCDAQAQRSAQTITSYYDDELGIIPAILDGNDKSAIIPAIEALIYPYFSGCQSILALDGEFAAFLEKLKVHTLNILQPGVCLFDDGGWKLSSNNENSWISKIFLCQFAAHEILGIPEHIEADNAHMDWWINGCTDCPAIDQIFSGKVSEHGFHYPRGVSSYIWLFKG
ncbi:MAG: glycoside hydrolase family 52 protein [Bacillota bacterium]